MTDPSVPVLVAKVEEFRKAVAFGMPPSAMVTRFSKRPRPGTLLIERIGNGTR